jgi:hypothetical protein
MAKDAKKQETVKPDETPVNETVQAETQNPAKGEVKDETPAEVQNSAEPETKVIIVLERFRDKTDHKTLFVVGQEVEFDIERANDVVSRGLAKFKENDEQATA